MRKATSAVLAVAAALTFGLTGCSDSGQQNFEGLGPDKILREVPGTEASKADVPKRGQSSDEVAKNVTRAFYNGYNVYRIQAAYERIAPAATKEYAANIEKVVSDVTPPPIPKPQGKTFDELAGSGATVYVTGVRVERNEKLGNDNRDIGTVATLRIDGIKETQEARLNMALENQNGVWRVVVLMAA